MNIKGEASSDKALLLFASWLGCCGVGVCMSDDGKLVLWVRMHVCHASCYITVECLRVHVFIKPVLTDSDYCFLCSAWLLCSVTIVAEHSWCVWGCYLNCMGVPHFH